MLGAIIKNKRLEKHLSMKDLSQKLGVDPSLLSRVEKGERHISRRNLMAVSRSLDIPIKEVTKAWLEDKVIDILDEYPEMAQEVLEAAESRVEYLTSNKALVLDALPNHISEKLKEIDKAKHLWAQKKPVKGLQLKKMEESFGVEYTFESNRIEGNTLSLQETFLVVDQGFTISGKSIQEHLEAINHIEAIDFIRELVTKKLDLTEYRLKQIHHLVLKGIDRKNAGQYRNVGVRIGGSKHEPPEPFMLPKLMEDYFLHYETQKDRMHPVLLAAEMHERLVTIHPFIDGNGRTARLVMNLILLRNGYTIANLKGSQGARMKYYSALENVQVNNNPLPFYELIAQSVNESLSVHLKLV
jgi:Fic family protein